MMKTRTFGYRGRALGTVAGLLALSAFAAPEPLPSNIRSVWSGVYTTLQAERGRATFEQACAACHKADLSGRGPIPALRGETFTGGRHGQSVADLYEAIRSTMPPGRPASLTPEAYADVVAYLLAANSFPPGNSELPSHRDALRAIVFDERADKS